MFYFQHDEHTGGDTVSIGENEVEALDCLVSEYEIELDDVVVLVLGGHVREAA